MHLQTIEFINEEFSRVSGFYKEKDGKRYQDKKAKIQILSFAKDSESKQKICTVPFNLSEFIGRGKIRESLNLSGAAYNVEFEILVEHSTSGDVSSSFAQPVDDLRSTMPVKSNSNYFAEPEPIKSTVSENNPALWSLPQTNETNKQTESLAKIESIKPTPIEEPPIEVTN